MRTSNQKNFRLVVLAAADAEWVIWRGGNGRPTSGGGKRAKAIRLLFHKTVFSLVVLLIPTRKGGEGISGELSWLSPPIPGGRYFCPLSLLGIRYKYVPQPPLSSGRIWICVG